MMTFRRTFYQVDILSFYFAPWLLIIRAHVNHLFVFIFVYFLMFS